jgi:hypothetical protein
MCLPCDEEGGEKRKEEAVPFGRVGQDGDLSEWAGVEWILEI